MNVCAFVCARVCFICSLKLAGSPLFGGEASHGRRGLRLVRFMLNSVSISWLLPSLQQKAQRETQAHRNPLALTGAVFNHLSQGPGPRSTVNKHSIEIISSLFCSLIFVLPLLCLSLFPSPSASLSRSVFTLCFLSQCAFNHLHSSFSLSLFLLTPHPLGLLALFSRGSSSFFEPLRLFLPPRTWQQSGNLLSCSLFVPVSPPTWHAVKLRSDVKMSTMIYQDHRKIIYFILNLVERIF